jgi:arylsulfatase A-like enzyme
MIGMTYPERNEVQLKEGLRLQQSELPLSLPERRPPERNELQSENAPGPSPGDFSRRDFLKLSASLPLAGALRRLPFDLASPPPVDARLPNLLIVIFDALSAFNLSLYGYPRQTSPNLERFAALSTVYHNHHSAGNFTTPSTASLFTGVYPWTHRAINLNSLIAPLVQPHNLFALLDGVYMQSAFAQNTLADMLLYQFQAHLDLHEPIDRFKLAGRTYYDHLFRRDAIAGMQSMDQFLFKREEAHGSLFFSILNDFATQLSYKIRSARLKEIYPDGPPRLANTDVYFDLAQVMDGVMGLLDGLPQPGFTYLHFMPPHAPYTPSRQYLGLFADGWTPPAKKKHRLAPGVQEDRLNTLRLAYDQFVANLDAEFGRMLDHLESRGALENSYIIFTSDHGEMFERGATGHSTPLIFEPGIRIPLVIHAPGQQSRRDVRQLTSNVDLLPTLAALAGQPIPGWCQGFSLPGLGGGEDPQRSLFVVEAKANPAFGPLRKATLGLMRGPYKLVHYLGYKYYSNNYEFYDLENDPQELHDLYPDHPVSKDMQLELDAKLAEVNRL